MIDRVEAGYHIGEVVVQQELASKILHVGAQVSTAVEELLCSEQVTSIAALWFPRDYCFLREQYCLQHDAVRVLCRRF